MVTKALDGPQDVPAIATQPEEFDTFYREHLPFLSRYLARRIDDPFLIADLTADVFLRVIRSADSYHPELGPPRAWLTGIARNVVADHRQSRAREHAAARRLHGRRLLDEDSTERIVQRIAAESDARALLASIADLPAALRSVVELVAVDGLAVAEAAAVLNISAGAARVRYHRARRVLQSSPTSQLHEVTP